MRSINHFSLTRNHDQRKNGSARMAEKHYQPPVTGELIMGCPSAAGRPARDGAPDVLDAEYETLRLPAPAGCPRPAISPAATTHPPGLDLLRQGTLPKRAGSDDHPGRAISWSACLLLVAGAFWMSGGHSLLDGAMAVRSQALPLRVTGLETRIGASSGQHHLFVQGEVVNDRAEAQALPDLSINILRANGETTRYFLGTNGQPLAGGGRFAFSSRLVAPKEGVKSVSVTFRE
jgi:hypothetical protein